LRLALAPCSLPLAASLGTASAEDQDGKHEMKRAPAAITSLSAASRCASRPPSDPSGSSPQSKSRSAMTGSPHFWSTINQSVFCRICPAPGISVQAEMVTADGYPASSSGSVKTTEFVTLR